MTSRFRFRTPRTLRWQVMAWHSLWLCLVIIAFGGTLFWLHRRAKWQEIDSELASAVEVLRSRLWELTIPENAVLSWDVPTTFRPRRIGNANELPYFAIWNASQRLIAESDTQSRHQASLPDANARFETRKDSTIYYLYHDGYREAIASFNAQHQPVLPSDEAQWTILIGRDVQPDRDDIRNFLLTILLIGAFVIAIGLVGDWWLAKRLIAPIEQIARTAADISETNLSRRIDTHGMSLELATLGTTLNDTFNRIESAFEQQKQFTADASHELRTPLATMQLHHQLALSKERTAEQYRETITTCQRAATQMNRLVQSLLQLARLDVAASMILQPVRLDGLVQETLSGLQSVAAAQGVKLQTELDATELDGDPLQLEQLIINLVMNAIEHSPRGSQVEVQLKREESTATLKVIDHGCGIASEHLPHLFKRFYRVDRARDRASGGCGLGLSICQQIVDRHHATIGVESELGVGSVFTATFPNKKDTAIKN